MAGYDGTIRINTQLDNKGFSQGVSQMHSGLNSVVGSIKGLTKALGVGLSLAGLVAVGKQAVELASDLQEVQNVVDTSFKSMSYKMEEFAKTSVEQFGLSKLAAKQMGSTFMAMASNMVPSMEKASDMAIALTGRAADMASFYNKTASETATALNSIFTGETETLKQYGVVMTEANLQQYAYQQGIKKTLSDMSQAEKVQLRYNYVMEQTSLAAGDFAKTSDSWANQTRILSEQFKELLSILGSGLIQVLTPVVQGLNIVLSKLIEVANAIGTIMSKLLGLNSVKLSASGQSAADGFAAATDNVEGYTDAVNKADKANKGSVASFDELTMLQSKSSSGSGTDLSFDTAGMQEFTTEAVAGEEQTEKMSQQFEKILSYIKQLSDSFKAGFLSGLKDAKGRLAGITEDLLSIRDSVLNIFEDGSVMTSFGNMGLSIAEAFGKVVGSFASIGLSIAENLIGGIDSFLQMDGERIKAYLISMFDITADIAEIVGDFAIAFAEIFTAFGGENGQSLTANLISIFSECFMGINNLAINLGKDVLNAFTTPIIENKGAIKTALDGWLGVMASFAGTAREAIVYAFDAFGTVYDTYISPLIESTGTGLSNLVALFMEFWNTYIQPMLEEWSAYFSVIIEEHIKPLIDSVMNFIASLMNELSVFWNDVMVPFMAWIIQNILPVLQPIIKAIGKNIMNCYGVIADVLAGILDILAGVIDFVVGVFTGDWQLAWDGITSVVKGAINIIIDFINGMIRALFNGINAAVDLINGLLGKIPESIRSKIGISALPYFEAPQIPRLATGTVVPPGMSQFLAVLGDNNKETEVVSPLSTMKEALMEAMVEMGGTGQSGDIIINIDGREVFRVVREQNKEYKKTTGKSAFA